MSMWCCVLNAASSSSVVSPVTSRNEIADIKDFIERFRYKPTKAVQVQSRIKQLEKIVPIEVDEVDNKQMHLKFPPCL